MYGKTVKEAFSDAAIRMTRNMSEIPVITPETVYQEGSPENCKIIAELIDQILTPEAAIRNKENLKTLYNYALEGKSCLILGEHYGNLDFPILYYLIDHDPDLGPEVARSIIAIQGMKLSESDSSVTTQFARSYNTIVIYPSRSIDKISDEAKKVEVRKISTPINHAAMKELITKKHQGRIILVYPSGTRYRPWDPESKKGVREIYSYLKTFDYIIFQAMNGNPLPPSRNDDMGEDVITKDLVYMTFSDVIPGREFRNAKMAETPEGIDPRQYIVDQVMIELDKLHDSVEPIRLRDLSRKP